MVQFWNNDELIIHCLATNLEVIFENIEARNIAQVSTVAKR